eukprot:359962-Chlamydomonas_euryale.AAC.1
MQSAPCAGRPLTCRVLHAPAGPSRQPPPPMQCDAMCRQAPHVGCLPCNVTQCAGRPLMLAASPCNVVPCS